MSTRPEKRSAFSTLALAAQFLHEAGKIGLTPALLQRLREDPKRMSDFVALARQAEADHIEKIVQLQHERERAVDIAGRHYHLVLVTLGNLVDWGCKRDCLISDVEVVAAQHKYQPLHEDAYPSVPKVLSVISSPGQWIGCTNYGGLAFWEITSQGVESRGSLGTAEGMRLSRFPELHGVVFMSEHPWCDYIPANQSRRET